MVHVRGLKVELMVEVERWMDVCWPLISNKFSAYQWVLNVTITDHLTPINCYRSTSTYVKMSTKDDVYIEI